MSLLNISLRDLEYLLALHQHGHFGRAAEACHVSQPTLSGQLAKLEEQLGLLLVDRSRRQIRFTAAGEALIGRAQKIVRDVQELVDEARRWQDPLAGELRLGIIPTVAPYLLPLLLAGQERVLPQLTLILREAQTDTLVAALEAGELDALVVAELPRLAPYAKAVLYDEPMLLATAPNHPLAGQEALEQQALEGRRLLMLEDGHCLRDQALGYCADGGGGEDTSFRATSLETLRQLVASGRGITLLPALAAKAEGGHAVCYRRFSLPQPARRSVLLWRRGAGLDRTCRPLAAMISDVVKPQLAGYSSTTVDSEPVVHGEQGYADN